jgi:segregation and condensation protein B
MNNEQIYVLVEALLFALGRPATFVELARKLDVSADTIQAVVRSGGRTAGIVMVADGTTVELRANADASELIEEVRKEEFSRDIGRAGLEALAAIVYRGPLSRSEIDFIRGVNSSQTLRTLLMRGIVRKVPNPKDERSFLYEPTTELLAQLGIAHITDAPDYAKVREKLSQLEASYRNTFDHENS